MAVLPWGRSVRPSLILGHGILSWGGQSFSFLDHLLKIVWCSFYEKPECYRSGITGSSLWWGLNMGNCFVKIVCDVPGTQLKTGRKPRVGVVSDQIRNEELVCGIVAII